MRSATPKTSSRRRFSSADAIYLFYRSGVNLFRDHFALEGRGGESIGQLSHNKDPRPDLKQMVVGMAVDVEGRAICCEMRPGNTADVTTLVPVVNRMRQRFRLREITVVVDRGVVSQAILEAFESSDSPDPRYRPRPRSGTEQSARN